jgi:hypothetical protein
MGDMIEIFKAAVAKRVEPETTIQINRIVADGGVVIDPVFMNSTIKLLKSLGIYGNAKLLTDANFGVKKDGSGAISKLYDISGNNNDATQSTGASQPIWSLVNGRGVITYDGVNNWLDCGNNPSMDNIITASTIYAKIYPSVNGTMGIFDRESNGQGSTTESLWAIATGIKLNVVGVQSLTFINNNNTRWNSIYGSFNSSVITISINNVTQTAVQTANAVNRNNKWLIGAMSTLGLFPFKGIINSIGFFNIYLTPSQITTLYNAGL